MIRTLMTLVSTLLVFDAPALRADPATSLVGLWLGKTTDGGLGGWLELRPNGTAQFSFGALVEFKYRLEGTSLRLTGAGQPEELPPADIRVEGNTATKRQSPPPHEHARETLSPEDQALFDRLYQPVTMTRVGTATPGVPPIVGTWTYPHYTGPTAYETYTPNGQMVLRVPMQTVEGTYTATSGPIVLKLPQGEQTIAPNGDTLVLRSMDGETSIFRRAPK